MVKMRQSYGKVRQIGHHLSPTDAKMTFIMKIKFKITNLHIEEATREAQKLTEAQKSLTPRTNSENTNSEYRYDIFAGHRWPCSWSLMTNSNSSLFNSFFSCTPSQSDVEIMNDKNDNISDECMESKLRCT